METIYADIAARTGGNIYIGVTGPVRTGKSTFIKRIMETVVIPNIADPYRQERAKDELPQSGSGRTIMTAEPKFVPEEAVEISPDGTSRLKIRMIDSVGYMVDGASGADEDGKPRMVTTPWYDHEIPMTEAAELGTRKVMEDHCSLGFIVTTDGTVTDIPRSEYVTAERRAITDMQKTGKPFLVIINTREPEGKAAEDVRSYLKKEFSLEPVIADCQALDAPAVGKLLTALLYSFPMTDLKLFMPRWLNALEPDHPLKSRLFEAFLSAANQIHTLNEAVPALTSLRNLEEITDCTVTDIDLATGSIQCSLVFPEKLFYQILSEKAGIPIETDAALLSLLTELSEAKHRYDRISDALSEAEATGYGIVMPAAEDMQLEKPEIVRKNGTYGVRMRASAPSIHMIRVDIDTQINPMVGDEKQSRELIAYLNDEKPETLWESNIFGKSVYELIQEGLSAKLIRMPEEVRSKFRGSLGKIVNEGANGLICILL